MTAFLWTFFVFGILEVGGSVGYLLAGTWPERTKAGIVISLVLWSCIAAWAGFLLRK